MHPETTEKRIDTLPPEKAELVSEDLSAQIDFARFAHSNLQDMVKFADSKATGLLAVLSVVLTLLGGTSVHGAGTALATHIGAPLLFWLIVLPLPTFLAILACVSVLQPNWRVAGVTPPSNSPRLLWVGPSDLNRFGTCSEHLVMTLACSSPSQHLSDTAYENLKIAEVLRQKFERLSAAIKYLGAALISWLVIVVFSAVGVGVQ